MSDEWVGRLAWWFLLSLPWWAALWTLERLVRAVAGLVSILADRPGPRRR